MELGRNSRRSDRLHADPHLAGARAVEFAKENPLPCAELDIAEDANGCLHGVGAGELASVVSGFAVECRHGERRAAAG